MMEITEFLNVLLIPLNIHFFFIKNTIIKLLKYDTKKEKKMMGSIWTKTITIYYVPKIFVNFKDFIRTLNLLSLFIYFF